ncbi:MAG: glycosyl hydrolase family 17 protein [Exilibacterium sp.]
MTPNFTTEEAISNWIQFSVGNTTTIDYGSPSLFQAMLDSVREALAGTAYRELPIAIGETGWPTQGDQYNLASVENARSFNQNLIDIAKSADYELYLFELFDESAKVNESPDLETQVEPHWGIYGLDEALTGMNAIYEKYGIDFQ